MWTLSDGHPDTLARIERTAFATPPSSGCLTAVSALATSVCELARPGSQYQYWSFLREQLAVNSTGWGHAVTRGTWLRYPVKVRSQVSRFIMTMMRSFGAKTPSYLRRCFWSVTCKVDIPSLRLTIVPFT